MTMGEFRALLADVPDTAEIDFKDMNFGGATGDLSKWRIDIEDDKSRVLLEPAHWEYVD